MIAEVVVGIADANIEGYSAIQFLKVGFHVGAMLKNEVDDVKVAMACVGIIAIAQA